MADKSEKPYLSERSPGRNYDVYESPDRIFINADGTLEFAMGPNLTRVDLHRVREIVAGGANGEPVEVRERIATVTLPTNIFVEFMGLALTGLRANEAALAAHMQGQIAAVHDLIGSFRPQ
jgi:hypothetical protein